MLSCYSPKHLFNMSPSIREYAMTSTLNSIRRLTDNYNLERNTLNHTINQCQIYDKNDNNGNPFFYGLFGFLSMTTIGFLIYQRLK